MCYKTGQFYLLTTGKERTYTNLMLTMLLGGLWHGANWTFVAWGGIHGVGLAVERLIADKREIEASLSFVARWIRQIIVFNLVCLAWVFFRIPSFGGAWEQVTGLFTWQWLPIYGVALQFLTVYSVMLFLVDLHLEASGGEYLFEHRPLSRRLVTGIMLCILITLLGANQVSAFIYFQF
jgi:alginate O-acetyltransferase complex protein AlgI